jgi:hypothetical protein
VKHPRSSTVRRLPRASVFSSIEALEARIAPAAANLNLASLDGTNGFKLSGVAVDDESGRSVSGAGDVNGDGFDDLIIGAFRADPNGSLSGASYVVFGAATGFSSNLELSALDGTNGFKISGVAPGDNSGESVSRAGDINGDGFDDLIIGARFADSIGNNNGASYVVFGKATGFAANLELSALDGTNGFKLSGVAGSDESGTSVSDAGDVNGDGFDDLIIGARGADPNGLDSGASYVVFGKATGFAANLDLSTLDGTNGFKLSGVAEFDRSGYSVSGAGDVNGDGFDDVIIGAHFADSNGVNSGSSYVIFGKATGFSANLELSALDGTNGFKISGVAENNFSGSSVSGAGDVNGDGFDDLIIGARRAASNGTDSGASYVVFGKATGFASNLDLSTLDGTNGFKISGVAAYDFSGSSVSGAGDMNGDGFDDVIIGAYFADPNGASSGASYLVFGKAAGFAANLELSTLDGTNGFRIGGVAAGNSSGISVSGAGDVNGDGVDDLIIGALFADPNGSRSGASYVVFGTRGSSVVDGKTTTFTDADGDKVTVKVSKGDLSAANFIFAPDGTLQEINLNGDSRFSGANITITAKAVGNGDGVVNVGFLNAANLDLGKVKISGNLGLIIAGDGDAKKGAIKSLTVGSLGTTDIVVEPLLSEIAGSLGKLTVQGDVRGAALTIAGKLGKATIGGDLVGDPGAGAAIFASILEGRGIKPRVGGGIPVGAVDADGIGSFRVTGSIDGGTVSSDGDIGSVNVNQDVHGSAIAAAGQIKVVRVFGSLTSEDPAQPTLVAALAKVGSTKPAGAVAIDKLTVNGDVENAQILLGYRREVVDEQTSYVAKNPDASGGKVVVNGDWKASSLVAGVFDASGDGFGQNDELIEGDATERIFARIASIVIKGTATGSGAEGDHYAITAQQVGKVSVNGEKLTLSKSTAEKDDILLDQTNGDFRLVEV